MKRSLVHSLSLSASWVQTICRHELWRMCKHGLAPRKERESTLFVFSPLTHSSAYMKVAQIIITSSTNKHKKYENTHFGSCVALHILPICVIGFYGFLFYCHLFIHFTCVHKIINVGHCRNKQSNILRLDKLQKKWLKTCADIFRKLNIFHIPSMHAKYS